MHREGLFIYSFTIYLFGLICGLIIGAVAVGALGGCK